MAMFSKNTSGRTAGGMKSLLNIGWERLQATAAKRDDALPPAPEAMSSRWLEYAAEPEPQPESPPGPAPAEPAMDASTWTADPAAISIGHSASDDDQIQGRHCRMDAASTVDGLEFTIEVPGVHESDLDIRMVDDTIVISGQLERDRTDKTYRVAEREYGPFSRLIRISKGVPLHRIQASLDRGVLTVFVPNPTVQVGTIAVNSAVRRIIDGDDADELRIDLPGADESDVDLAVRDGVLTISCRKGPHAADAVGQAADRLAPRLLQSLEVPAGVNADQIRAVLAKGVLTVTLPIAAGHRRRTIALEAAGEAANSGPETSDIGAPPSLADGHGQSRAPLDAQWDSRDCPF
jgi:HSP20 family molecular chaperone IbpA